MYRNPGETFVAYLDRTLADVRSELICANETYREAVEQQILNHVVSEISRKVHGELNYLGRVRNLERG